jgi:hypothetical protein
LGGAGGMPTTAQAGKAASKPNNKCNVFFIFSV